MKLIANVDHLSEHKQIAHYENQSTIQQFTAQTKGDMNRPYDAQENIVTPNGPKEEEQNIKFNLDELLSRSKISLRVVMKYYF